MKKKYLLLTLLAFSTHYAQERPAGTIEVSPTVGLMISEYMGYSDYYYSEPLSSSTTGVGLDYYFNPIWSLRTGLHYQILGQDYYKYSGNYREQLHFVSLPIQANFHFSSKRNWNVALGPSFNYLVDNRLTFNKEEYKLDGYKDVHVAFKIGIGHTFRINENLGIGVEMNHQFGLTKIHQNSFTYDDDWVYSSYLSDDLISTFGATFGVSLVYSIPFSKPSQE